MKFRSYYKVKQTKKGSKLRDREMGKGASQGAVVAPNLAPPSASTSAAASASAPGKAPQQQAQGGGGQQKKGKGKGKA